MVDDERVGVAAPFDGPLVRASARELESRPLRLQSRALPQALAAASGWAEEDNGLLHVRGVDDGVLFVEDGIPVYDRVDVAFGIPPSLAAAGTVAIGTGHTSARYGLKSGAVVWVDSPPAPRRWLGDVQTGTGSSALGSATASDGRTRSAAASTCSSPPRPNGPSASSIRCTPTTSTTPAASPRAPCACAAAWARGAR